MEWMLIKTVLSLCLVLGVMAAVLFVAKRYLLPGTRGAGGSLAITVLAARTMGPKRSLQVVQVGNRILVLGLSEQGITMLTELPPESASVPEPTDDARTEEPVDGEVPGTFLEYLNSQVGPLLRRRKVDAGGSMTLHAGPQNHGARGKHVPG